MKLAASRIKLLKNKREAQVKQLKRELAQLLEAGQDQTARIRVEHAAREEKTMAAYELIEIYCELIVARLPIIESQKNCPIDLKEAISSVLFASPRCADVPELMDVRKHFIAKYGKEFVNAATELRPDCGVSRLLVEKLSAKAPDGPTKIKMLTAIAEEHNVKWDPKSFGEKDVKPPEDLLDGPSTFDQASKSHVGPPNAQQPPYAAPYRHDEKHDVPTNSYDPNSRSSLHSANSHQADIGSRNGTQYAEYPHPYSGEQGQNFGRQSWKMEFKDATAAAQAAAESAEQASMAARAAAELSRMSRQHSAESQRTSFVTRDEAPQTHADFNSQGEHFASDPAHTVSYKGNLNVPRVQNDGFANDDLVGLAERFNNLKSSYNAVQPTSSNSSHTSIDDYRVQNKLHMKDTNSQKSSSELKNSGVLGGSSIEGISSDYLAASVSKDEDGMRSDNFEEASMRKQSSNISFNSHSRTHTDDVNIFSNFNQRNSIKKTDEDHFNTDEGRFTRSGAEASFFENAAVVFDDSGSDDNEMQFDAKEERDNTDFNSNVPAKGRIFSSNLSANANASSHGRNTNKSVGRSSSESLFAPERKPVGVFSEGLISDAGPSKPDDLLPMAFDDSDGPSSEEEEELNKSKLAESTSTGYSPYNESLNSRNPEFTKDHNPRTVGSSHEEKRYMGYSNKTSFQLSSFDSDAVEVHSDRNQGIEGDGRNSGNFGYANLSRSQPSFKPLTSNELNLEASGHPLVKENGHQQHSPVSGKAVEPSEESHSDVGKELNFEILTGGLRNKGYRQPPYHRNPPSNSSLSKKAAEDTSSGIEESYSSHKHNFSSSSRYHDQEPYNQIVHPKVNETTSSRTPVTNSDSDEELIQQNFGRNSQSNNRETVAEGNKNSISKTYFDSDDSDYEDNLATHASTGKSRPGTAFSRRTKATSSRSERDSLSKARVPHASSVSEDFTEERKSSFEPYATKTHLQPQSQTKSINYRESTDQQRLTEQAASRIKPQSFSSSSEESSPNSFPAVDNQRRSSTHLKISDYRATSKEPRSAEQPISKPIPEFKRSSHEGSIKSSDPQLKSNPPSKPVAPNSAETSKHPSSHGETPSRGNSIGQASHVHPKLPDYDTLTAQLLSLRKNRQ